MLLDIPKGCSRWMCSTYEWNQHRTLLRQSGALFSLSSLNPHRVAHQGTQAIKRSAQHRALFFITVNKSLPRFVVNLLLAVNVFL